MSIETHNWASSAHQELHKIIREEIFPIVNQVDARLQNFEIQFLKEAATFVGDFKSLANEADASLAKHTTLELEIERLLKAVVSQDIMIIVQNEFVVDTSDLHTELERTKKCLENYIIKKETKYAKLWNDWYKKCDECKYDKISYDKAYKNMQQKIERLQAQLGDLKGKSKDTSSVSDTRNPLSQKLKNKNIELEFQVLNYARENAHLKTNALSKPVTSNSVSTPQESKGVNNDKVIAPGMFRINPSKTSREEKHVPNTVSPKVTKPKKVEHQKSIATPKPIKPRFLLRWSPTGKLFDQEGQIVDSSESKSKSDCSNGYSDLFMVRRFGLFQAYDSKSKASYQFHLEVYGNGLLRE
nr:hypothetical protein [Tanacetum cinerariifolium]